MATAYAMADMDTEFAEAGYRVPRTGSLPQAEADLIDLARGLAELACVAQSYKGALPQVARGFGELAPLRAKCALEAGRGK